MFVGEQEIFYEKLDEKWEIGISKSLDNSFNQISLVNGISTYNGGTHVNSVTNQITKKIQETLLKRNKKLNVKQNDIKNHLFVFVNCKVVNPDFDTQAKENLISRITSPEVSDNLIKKIAGSAMIDELIRFLMIKEDFDAKKDIAKSKVKIGKLDDAAKAGTSESEKCLIFLAEGDSASSSVIAGLSSVPNPDYFGVFPLKGKPLNVRDVNMSKIKENEEIKNIINILGLEFGKKYTDLKKLRYGKVVLMADADCVDENTLVLTKRGYVPIKDITYEDYVFTHNNRWKKIKNIIKTNKTNLIRLTINNEEYTFGENHELPILRGEEVILVKAKDIQKTDKVLKRKNMIMNIEEQLKECLKTNNEWKPDFNERTLPPFVMGKAKHNNRTGLNTFDSDTKVIKSFGRKKRPPLGYTCEFNTEEDGNYIQKILLNYGINAALQTYPSTSIRLDLAQANKFINEFKK